MAPQGTPTTTNAASATTAATPTCTTAVRGKYGSVPPGSCDSYYNYEPNFEAALAFAVLFGIVTLVQLAQAWVYRKGFCWVIILAATWETASFILRALGDRHQNQLAWIIGSQLLLLLSPLLINAFAYMTAGRMIWYFLPEKKIYRVKATSLTKYFVWADFITFLVQASGGSMLSSQEASSIKIGQNVYMAGTGLQQLFIVLFTVLIVKFHRRMKELERTGGTIRTEKWQRITYTLYAVLLLITLRICFRLAEFAKGTEMDNPVMASEYYVLMLDALPMLIALILLSITHPGMVLVGPESEFPKLTKAEKKALKQRKKEEKRAKKEAKRHGKRSRIEFGSSNEHLQMEEGRYGR